MNSNRKGKCGEREAAAFLREVLGPNCKARRGQQYKGTADSPDIVGAIPACNIEVKRVQRLNVAQAMHKAIDESLGADVEDGACPISTPVLMHRRNHDEWLITIMARDVVCFAEKVLALVNEEIKHA